ncbi:MAG: hypothetical protein ABIG45_00525, partial [Bacillota bacterium]
IKLMMQSGGSDVQVAAADSSGTLSYQSASLFHASQPKELNFYLFFYWNDSELPGSFLDGNAVVLPLTVYVRGVQHVS